ncbi:hypothetical protein ACFL5V_02660 [Fibrobacterota bacterium]
MTDSCIRSNIVDTWNARVLGFSPAPNTPILHANHPTPVRGRSADGSSSLAVPYNIRNPR